MCTYNYMTSDRLNSAGETQVGICRKQMLEYVLCRLHLALLYKTQSPSLTPLSLFLAQTFQQLLPDLPKVELTTPCITLPLITIYCICMVCFFFSHYNVISMRGSPVAKATRSGKCTAQPLMKT